MIYSRADPDLLREMYRHGERVLVRYSEVTARGYLPQDDGLADWVRFSHPRAPEVTLHGSGRLVVQDSSGEVRQIDLDEDDAYRAFLGRVPRLTLRQELGRASLSDVAGGVLVLTVWAAFTLAASALISHAIAWARLLVLGH